MSISLTLGFPDVFWITIQHYQLIIFWYLIIAWSRIYLKLSCTAWRFDPLLLEDHYVNEHMTVRFLPLTIVGRRQWETEFIPGRFSFSDVPLEKKGHTNCHLISRRTGGIRSDWLFIFENCATVCVHFPPTLYPPPLPRNRLRLLWAAKCVITHPYSKHSLVQTNSEQLSGTLTKNYHIYSHENQTD